MQPNSIFVFIVSISVIGYLAGQLLEYLNYATPTRDLPSEIEAFYDRDQYLKSLHYHKEQTRFSFFTAAFSFVLSIGMLASGGFGYLDGWLRTLVYSDILLALSFFGIILIASDILTLPFQLYGTFVIEEKYGFNKTTVATFFLDKGKGYVLGGVVGGLLLSIMIYLIERIGPDFWWLFGVIAAVFILLVNVFYTSLILPLFNKLAPLPDGELRAAIEDFSRKVDFPLDNVFIMDGSKRSNKANAFFSGLGKRKKIVLYDTLLSNHSTKELLAVLAHEVGHFKKKHIVIGYALSVGQIFFSLFILSRMVFNENLSLALGGSQQAIHLNLLAFGILFSPISGITGLVMNWYSRRNEFEADAFARETFSGSALADALKKLSVDSLSNLHPHPLYVFFHYSHPPLLERLKAIETGN